jgi:hypothetical protein
MNRPLLWEFISKVVDRGLDNPELLQNLVHFCGKFHGQLDQALVNLVHFYGKFFGKACDGHVSCVWDSGTGCWIFSVL